MARTAEAVASSNAHRGRPGLRRRGMGSAALVLLATAAAIACAACGTTTAVTSTRARTARAPALHQVPITVAAPKRVRLSGHALTAEVNVVCAAVRRGAPQALVRPFTVGRVRRHAAAADPESRRTATSLARLAATGGTRGLTVLVGAWRQLAADYDTARLAVRGPRAARQFGMQIAIQEAGLSALARSAGAPACAVAGQA